jgi:uncharacterized protein YndB with AHSA1/START domain
MVDEERMPEQTDNFVQISYSHAQPPSRLWQARIDPSIVKKWFGSDPNGNVLVAELDVRVEGSFRVRFANSDASAFTAKGISQEIEIQKKLVFTDVF